MTSSSASQPCEKRDPQLPCETTMSGRFSSDGCGSALRAMGIGRSGTRGENHSIVASGAALNQSSIVTLRPAAASSQFERRGPDGAVTCKPRRCVKRHAEKQPCISHRGSQRSRIHAVAPFARLRFALRGHWQQNAPLIRSTELLSLLTKGLGLAEREEYPRCDRFRAGRRSRKLRRRGQEVGRYTCCRQQERAAAGAAARRASAAAIHAQAFVDPGRAGLLRALHAVRCANWKMRSLP